MTFTGRVCAITGAGSGIGRALALELARRGSDVALCDIDEAGLEETATQAEALGRRVSRQPVDVADRDAVHAFAESVLTAHGRVDAIVNNAGVTVAESFEAMSYEDLEWVMNVNFWGVVHGTKAFLPHLLERRDGWVVNISSIFGMIAFPTQSAYNATKFAVRGMTESLRQELEGTGVTATCVHPGGIKTNIVRNARFHRDVDGGRDRDNFVREFDRAARTTAEHAAEIIADGMAARSPRILVGADAHALEKVARLAPVSYPKVIRAIVDRMRR